jgi:4-hydroxybenzoate polyprenyltransferase
MVVMQASVGALNDLIDAPRDAGLKPGKPIPAGLVTPDVARVSAAVAAVGGLALAVPSGVPTVVLALAILGIGYAYDAWAKGTVWSWFPFAVAIPLFPAYGWLGAAGGLAPFFAVLLPAAVLAGTALAIANARADIERDRAAGVDSVAVRLGMERSWAVHAAILAVVGVAALIALIALGGPPWAVVATVGSAALVAVAVVQGRRADPAGRERAWELEAVGVGLLAAVWLAGVTVGGA